MTVNKKAYISGRISSQPWQQVKKSFTLGCRYAESEGYEPISPLAGVKGKNWQWQDFMLDDLRKLSECSRMFVLGTPEQVKESYGVQIELLWARKLGIEITHLVLATNKNDTQMLTDFEFFIATLPDWDGKDRVSGLEELVKAETIIFDKNDGELSMPDSYEKFLQANEDYRDYSDKWVRRVIREVLQGVTDIFFIGKQGIGKSTLIRYLFPFEYTMRQYSITEEKLIANCVSLHEAEYLPDLPKEYSGSLICYLGKVDYSYTNIDIKQLYAQVLAEQKKQHKR